MSTWFSEYRVRTLAEHIAPRILPKVEAALGDVFRANLPGLLMDAIRHEMGAEHAPKGSVADKRDRDTLIRAMYNGRNSVALAHKFRISASQVRRIGGGVKAARANSP